MKFQHFNTSVITKLSAKLSVTALVLASLSACSQSPSPHEMARIDDDARQAVNVLNNTAPPRRVSHQSSGSLANLGSNVISAEDILDVNVFKVPDLSAKKLTVESNGAISLPMIGSVKVQGMSISQAEKTIQARLKSFMQDPKVSITRTDKAISKRVTVEGEVRTPGVFPIKGNLSFLQAIAMSQGLTKVADTRNVFLYRDGQQHKVNLGLIRIGKVADPILRHDDRIVVLKDAAKVRERKIIEYLPAVTAPFSIFR